MLTSFTHCHSRMKLGLETNVFGARVRFQPPFNPNRFFAFMLPHERARWGRPNWLCPWSQ